MTTPRPPHRSDHERGDEPDTCEVEMSYVELSAEVYARIEREFTDADDLLISLMAVAFRIRSYPVYFGTLNKADGRQLSLATSAVHRKTAHWPWRQGLKTYAREALVGWELRNVLPAIAAEMEQPWTDSVSAWHEIRALGQPAEECAMRLLVSWKQPVTELPPIVAVLIDQQGYDLEAPE